MKVHRLAVVCALALLSTFLLNHTGAVFVPQPGYLYVDNNLVPDGAGGCTGSVQTRYGVEPLGTAGLVDIRAGPDCSIIFNFTKLSLPETAKREVTAAINKIYNPVTGAYYGHAVSFTSTGNFATGLDGCPQLTTKSSAPDVWDTYERGHWPLAPGSHSAGCTTTVSENWNNDNGDLLDSSRCCWMKTHAIAHGAALNPDCDWQPEFIEDNTLRSDRTKCYWYPTEGEPDYESGNKVIEEHMVGSLTSFTVHTPN